MIRARLRSLNGRHRAKEHHMTSNSRILGTLTAAGDNGVVRMEDRFDTDIDDVWSALTDRNRLAVWYGDIEGDIAPGGEYRAHLHASGWEGTGRIEAFEAPAQLLVAIKDSEGPGEGALEVTLAPDGDGTSVVWEERGMPAHLLAAYGAGIQIHVEDLGAYLAGDERCSAEARFGELFPAYQELVANDQ
jgi:uncharacterized protein YndB with AHSA1/START domain